MKRISLLLLLALLLIKGYSQFSISNDRENRVYLGIDNPISIAVENTSCDSLIIITDNGIIIRSGRSYVWRPKEVGKGIIWVWKLDNRDTIKVGGAEFRTEKIPNPTACIGGKKDGKIDKNRLIAAGAIIPIIENLDICINILVLNFTMIVMRNDTVIYSEEFKGNRLSDKAKDFIKKLKEGDVVLFAKIKAKGYEDSLMSLKPIELIIE